MSENKHLYEGLSYSKEATDLAHSIYEVVDPLMKSYIGKGFSPREISTVMNEAIMDLMLGHNLALRASIKKKK